MSLYGWYPRLQTFHYPLNCLLSYNYFPIYKYLTIFFSTQINIVFEYAYLDHIYIYTQLITHVHIDMFMCFLAVAFMYLAPLSILIDLYYLYVICLFIYLLTYFNNVLLLQSILLVKLFFSSYFISDIKC